MYSPWNPSREMPGLGSVAGGSGVLGDQLPATSAKTTASLILDHLGKHGVKGHCFHF